MPAEEPRVDEHRTQLSPAADLWRLRPVRYLIVGGFNTLAGYGLGVGLYLALSPALHILIIGLIANLLAISLAFTTHKLFVFRTQGGWLAEYARSYLVYGGSALVGILALWALVDGWRLPIWIAQALVIPITVVVSYIGHARFTFRRPGCVPLDGPT
jgi:putative flippase GtrA